MSKNDDRILEHLARHGARRPRQLRSELAERSAALDLRAAYLQKRLEILVDAGLLENDGFRYLVSARGVAYLEGELDASALDRSNPQ
ncbi:ArsR family transcriptional regulator [Halostagnicola bangensis]